MNQPFDLSPFDKHSKDEWIMKVTSELKDNNSLKKLRWEHEKDLLIDPIYFEEDLDKNSFQKSRGVANNDWHNLAPLDSFSNEFIQSLKEVTNFCDGYLIDCRNESQLPANIKAASAQKDRIHFKNLNAEALVSLGSLLTSDHCGSLGQRPCQLNSEPSGVKDEIEKLLGLKNTYFENFSSIIIPGNEFFEIGASIVQEVGISLSLLTEYYVALDSIGSDLLTNEVEISTSLDQDYFHGIAKLRAFRNLVAAVQDGFKMQHHDLKINVSTSSRYKTSVESTNNLVRNTVEGLAAITGSCDALIVYPADTTSHSRRTALNISNLLKEEAFMGRVVDPANGSYYIEHLTRLISDNSWSFFQAIENEGGYLRAKSTGWIDKQIASNREWLKAKTVAGSTSLININKYKKEMSKQDLDLFDPNAFRLSSQYEQEGEI